MEEEEEVAEEEEENRSINNLYFKLVIILHSKHKLPGLLVD